MIALVRVDDRLVHAQVVVGWLEFLRCRHLIVADERVVGDDEQMELYRMVVPDGVRLDAVDPARAAECASELEESPDPVLVLFSDPMALQTAVVGGFQPRAVNLGGMHDSPGRRRWIHGLFASDSEVAAIRNMIGKGIDFEIRSVPTSKRLEVPAEL